MGEQLNWFCDFVAELKEKSNRASGLEGISRDFSDYRRVIPRSSLPLKEISSRQCSINAQSPKSSSRTCIWIGLQPYYWEYTITSTMLNSTKSVIKFTIDKRCNKYLLQLTNGPGHGAVHVGHQHAALVLEALPELRPQRAQLHAVGTPVGRDISVY